ncbi:hypothetical protein BH18THE2_BH18THE2_10410 [soil metagenome]
MRADMLVKINSLDIEEKKVRVTLVDIDDFGSIVPLKELKLRIRPHDDSIIKILANSPYAALFTEGNNDNNNSIIILANGLTTDEINREKSKTIDRAEHQK